MNSTSIENIMYSGYVKYERLSRITFETFSNSSIASATELNVFIDLYSIMHSIFSEHDRTAIIDYTAITSCVINMCSHYRTFFNKLQVKTKFYIIFSFNTCDINRKFVAGYNESFLNKTKIEKFRNIAMNNFELLDILCPYLPDIFFVKSLRNFESSVIISHIINKLNSNTPNLIITKDLYPIQLTAIHPYTAMLKPIKRFSNDESIMIPINEKFSYREEFWNCVADKRKISIDNFINISPLNFPLVMAMSKFPERDIKPQITNHSVINKILYSIAEDQDIKIYPNQLYNNQLAIEKLPIAKIESIYNTLDILYMRPYYDSDPESKSIKFINIRDDAAVNHINSKFFSNNPIDLNRLQ